MNKERGTKKLRYGILGAAIIIMVLTIFFLLNTTDSETIDDETKALHELAILSVQNFEGTDKKGSTIYETFEKRFNSFYGGIDIINDPSTKLDWSAFHKLDEPDNIFEVHYHIKTYMQDSKYIFIVNLENGEVTSGNFEAKDIIEIVNSFSG
tara:strand:+ start:366 stop:821 length:456 start_codon:yes stop_codon:yes gene_type:complete